ncbi:hypothetical protein JCM10207_008263 [Rhodosporidiobolus poonsookiae]
MCRQFGMAIAPWDAIGRGKLCTQKQLDERKAAGEKFRGGEDERSDIEIAYSEVLAKIAGEHNIESVTAIALAYLMAKTTHVFPLIGGRKVSHLHDNIQAIDIKLTAKQIAEIDATQKFDFGFPHTFCGTDPSLFPRDSLPDNFLVKASGTLEFLPGPKPFNLAFGLVFNSGQCCCPGSRIFVQESIYDKFLEALTTKIKSMKTGPSFQGDSFLGATTSQLQNDRVTLELPPASHELATPP